MGSDLKDFRIPHAIEPCLAYRRWKVLNPHVMRHDNDVLVADWRQIPWDTREPMKARCEAYYPDDHCPEPRRICESCRCGLHGYYTLEDCLADDLIRSVMGYVVGITAHWGKCFFDNKWLRSEYAKLLVLITPEEGIYKDISTHRAGKKIDTIKHSRQWCKEVARKYDVPMLPLYDAELLASEHGIWVEGLEGDKVRGLDYD